MILTEREKHALNVHLAERLANRPWIESVVGVRDAGDTEIVKVDFSRFPYQLDPECRGELDGRDVYAISGWEKGDHVGKGNLPIYIVQIPVLAPEGEEACRERLGALVRQLREETFDTSPAASTDESAKRLVPVLGVNRAKSLDGDINEAFRQGAGVERARKVDICGRMWTPVWKSAPHQTVTTYARDVAYQVVKAIDPLLARALLDDIENKEILRKQVPYGSIRQWIKEHPFVAESVSQLVQQHFPLYLMTMDSDFVQLNRGGVGMFSFYDQAVEGRNRPDAITMGYALSNEELLLRRIAVDLDMRVRAATCGEIPLGSYFPEPNFAVRLDAVEDFERCEFDREFRRVNKKNGTQLVKEKTETLEALRFLRGRSPQSTYFHVTSPLVTPPRQEMITDNHQRVSPKEKKELGNMQTLKALRGVSQNHINPFDWASNLFRGLTIYPSKQEKQDLVSAMSKLFSMFDPIARAFELSPHLGRRKYNQVVFFEVLSHFPSFYDAAFTAIGKKDVAAFPYDDFCRSFKVYNQRDKDVLISHIQQLLQERCDARRDVLRVVKDRDLEVKIFRAAFAAGKALAKGLQDWADVLPTARQTDTVVRELFPNYS